MKKLPTIAVQILMIWVSSCQIAEEDLFGRYTPNGYKNKLDTLEIKPRGIYGRTILDKHGKLVLDMQGKWEFSNDIDLVLKSFFLNLDDDLVRFPEIASDTDYQITTPIRSMGSSIGFCVGRLPDENCYQKIA